MRSDGRAVLAAGVLLLVILAVVAGARPPAGPRIEVAEVWARPAMMDTSGSAGSGHGMAGTGAVYMRLANRGSEPDRLVGGETEVAKVVEIHETRMEGDVMKMRRLPDGLEVPAGGRVLLKPGGYHVMLIGIERDLKVDDVFALRLQFERSGNMTVAPEVRQP